MSPAVRRLLRNPLAVAGGVIVGCMALAAIFAPWLAPYNPYAINVDHILEGPSAAHWMGTDRLGRDVFSRILYGARVSLSVGFVAVGIATLIGVLLGSLAGYYGKWADSLIMRLVDIMLAVPTFFLVLAVIAFLEPNIFNVMAVIGLTSWMGVSRLVRAELLSLRSREFVLAARALGAGDGRLIGLHLLPNGMAPVLVAAILGVAEAILVESALSFLGLGVQPPFASWGNILAEGKDHIEFAWWLSLFPGLAIWVTVLGFNLFGEGLRDAFDPRQAGEVE
ncbi:ABC transporter permease [Thiohalorhabdus methylotrophus]|uniref:ABC transporter permease n=1 Tax=Thiohalorhabdus methylotrophus TaxID=3242694 RepID=A0ABV4TWX0_9GAMM